MKLNRIEEHMIEEFILRQDANPKVERIDNSRVVAGSPMYYYCKACGQFITALPEEHIRPAPKYCDRCDDLDKRVLLDEALRRAAGQKHTSRLYTILPSLRRLYTIKCRISN